MGTYVYNHGTGIVLNNAGQNPVTVGVPGTAGYIYNAAGTSYSGAAIYVTNNSVPWQISVSSDGTVTGATGSSGNLNDPDGGTGGLGINLTVDGTIGNNGNIRGGGGGQAYTFNTRYDGGSG